MSNILIPKPWHESQIKPIEEKFYNNRRQIIKSLGLVTGGLLTGVGLSACVPKNGKGTSNTVSAADEPVAEPNDFNFEGMNQYYPAKRNERYTLDRPITDEFDATHHNNFYEFISPTDQNIYNVYKYIKDFDNRDWKIEVSGLAKNTGTFYLGELIKQFGLEERTYRFRCVERWSMAVPWTGFPLAKLIEFLQPESNANFVKMNTYANKEQMPGVKNLSWYPWPYQEGLRMDEAMNELAFIATGLYGKPLPKQNGAPMRLVVPWKYGYKNVKSIAKLEFKAEQPETFWHQIAPHEYPFISNVNPEKPHPRWSQAVEYMIPDGDTRPTLKYNGYGEFVANLYES